MRRYALFAVATPERVRVFATSRPVETGEAGSSLIRLLSAIGLRSAAIAAGVTTDMPGRHAAVMIEEGVVRSVALIDSSAADAIRSLAENIGARISVVEIEPLSVPARRSRPVGYAVPIAFCLNCEDHEAGQDGSCTACAGIAALRRRGLSSGE